MLFKTYKFLFNYTKAQLPSAPPIKPDLENN
ncbi:hypothetical protein J471_5111, partial [Acinetobacter baumannii 1032359]